MNQMEEDENGYLKANVPFFLKKIQSTPNWKPNLKQINQ